MIVAEHIYINKTKQDTLIIKEFINCKQIPTFVIKHALNSIKLHFVDIRV